MSLKVRADFPDSMRIEVLHAYIGDDEFTIGDDVRVKECSDAESIAKIISLYLDCLTGRIMVTIQWYFKPKDTKDSFIIKSCSSVELFSSDSVMDIEISSIDGKVNVLSFEQVVNMEENDDEDDIYFTRAKWNYKEGYLDPPMNLWKTDCICNSIINPDIEFKHCSVCDRILHVECLKKTGAMICPSCGEDL
ncbi:hypothetical protein SteCoe_16002 [Stentor coeruleus]|uniref:BAH domain-containing protein n=1 Tax=Stentor coeruleus TaxID=5963 RepID=A0A1R2C2A3_9CILI|nr:hypothetical protein SteCoe_16002 [Stentor coeruleus]